MSEYQFIQAGKATPRFMETAAPKDFRRFFNKVTLNTNGHSGCWDLQGFCDRKGYGQFWYDGRMRWAHRWSYATFIDEIPEHDTIDHVCRNPSCVNPMHLRTLSNSENVARGNRDRVATEEKEEVPF